MVISLENIKIQITIVVTIITIGVTKKVWIQKILSQNERIFNVGSLAARDHDWWSRVLTAASHRRGRQIPGHMVKNLTCSGDCCITKITLFY